MLLFLHLVSATEGADTNSLEKIASLLDSLAAKITTEGETGEKAFEEYSNWCIETIRSKGFEIKQPYLTCHQ